jgi:hypothetical protein
MASDKCLDFFVDLAFSFRIRPAGVLSSRPFPADDAGKHGVR